jgi:nicotinate-nucleotide--dimethylbenzimidazole phosphoribosyltransferase
MNMRGAMVHIFTGLVLGVALAGLIHAPTQLVAQQEARTPVVRPKATTAGPWVEEQTVRLSPKVERELERQRTRRLLPKTVRSPKRAAAPAPSVLVRTTVPETPVVSPAPQPAYAEAKLKQKPKPKPTEKAPPKGAPVPASPPKVVASAPQPADEDNAKKPKKPKKPKKDKADKKGEANPSDPGADDGARHDEHKHGDD